MRQSYRSDEHAIATALVGVVDVAVERYALNRGGIHAAGERGRKSKGTVVDSAIRDCAIKVGADRYGRRYVELKAANAGRVAVFVIAIDATAHIQTREAKAVTRAFPNSTGAPNALTEQREATAVKTKLEM